MNPLKDVTEKEIDGVLEIRGFLVDKDGKRHPCQIPTYIPRLANANRDLFAISICTVDGQVSENNLLKYVR